MSGDICEKIKDVEKNLCAENTLNFWWENESKARRLQGFGLSQNFLLGKKMKVPNCMDTADFVLKLGVKNSKWCLFLDMRNADGHWIQLMLLVFFPFYFFFFFLIMAIHMEKHRTWYIEEISKKVPSLNSMEKCNRVKNSEQFRMS